MTDLASFAGNKFNWMDCLVRDHSLHPSAFKTAYAILQHVNSKTLEAWVSDETLSEITGQSRVTIQRHRQALKKARWLSWRRTKTASLYEPLFDKVDAGLYAIEIERKHRKERRNTRRERQPLKPEMTTYDASPVVQQDKHDASPVMQQDASPKVQRDASPMRHIHLRDNTYGGTPSKRLTEERPIEAIQHPQLAEVRLIEELGEGDSDRGASVAAVIGDRRFEYLLKELMNGTLYPSAVRSAARGIREARA
jgi:hypothetical protein